MQRQIKRRRLKVDKNNTISSLIEQKVSFVNSVVNVCMLWWASSIVFCGSVLAAVWSYEEKLKQQDGFVIGLGIVLFVFFFVIAIFGFLVADSLGEVQHQIAVLVGKLDYEGVKSEQPFFLTEIRTFQYSMRLGGGSFAIIHIVWSLFLLYLLSPAGICRCWYIDFGLYVIAFWIWILFGRQYKQLGSFLESAMSDDHE